MSVDSGFVYFNSMLSQSASDADRCRSARPKRHVFEDCNQRISCSAIIGPEHTAATCAGSHGLDASSDSDDEVCVHSLQGIGAPIVDYEIVARQQTFTVCMPSFRMSILKRYHAIVMVDILSVRNNNLTIEGFI